MRAADVLRLYEPWEVDDHHHRPLDWERCRMCEHVHDAHDCPTCGGHGSLRAAALETAVHRGLYSPVAWSDYLRGVEYGRYPARCEGCGHPIPWKGEATWEGADPEFGCWTGPTDATRHAVAELRAGREPDPHYADTHWSPCDEGCRHRSGGALRVHDGDGHHHETGSVPVELLERPGVARVEASWRHVDVRTIGWPFDLRPENLRVLCDRCRATQIITNRQEAA